MSKPSMRVVITKGWDGQEPRDWDGSVAARPVPYRDLLGYRISHIESGAGGHLVLGLSDGPPAGLGTTASEITEAAAALILLRPLPLSAAPLSAADETIAAEGQAARARAHMFGASLNGDQGELAAMRRHLVACAARCMLAVSALDSDPGLAARLQKGTTPP